MLRHNPDLVPHEVRTGSGFYNISHPTENNNQRDATIMDLMFIGPCIILIVEE